MICHWASYNSKFGDDDSPTNILLNEYSVPSCFSHNLFEVVEDGDGTNNIGMLNIEDDCESDESDEESADSTTNARPPYRLVLIGPERSGTGMHMDPLWTNA